MDQTAVAFGIIGALLLALITVGVFFIAWQQIRPDIQAIQRLSELTEKLTRENSDVMRQMSRMSQRLQSANVQLRRVSIVARDLLSLLLARGDFNISELTKDSQDWIINESSDVSRRPFDKPISLIKLKRLMIWFVRKEKPVYKP